MNNDKLSIIERTMNAIVNSQVKEADRQIKSAQEQTNYLNLTYGKARRETK